MWDPPIITGYRVSGDSFMVHIDNLIYCWLDDIIWYVGRQKWKVSPTTRGNHQILKSVLYFLDWYKILQEDSVISLVGENNIKKFALNCFWVRSDEIESSNIELVDSTFPHDHQSSWEVFEVWLFSSSSHLLLLLPQRVLEAEETTLFLNISNLSF